MLTATPLQQDSSATNQGSIRFEYGHQHAIIHGIGICEKILCSVFQKASCPQAD
jgi:hypothetical protein